MPYFNDLNLDDWKESEIWTDSLWIIPERDKTGKHSGFYHGNFIPVAEYSSLLRLEMNATPFASEASSMVRLRNEKINLQRHL